MRARATRTALFLSGLLMAGYGALVALRLLAHENLLVGILLLLVGCGLAWVARPPPRAAPAGPSRPAHARATLALGLVSSVGVLAYNALARSTLSLPELGILAYGAALLVAARHLGGSVASVRVATLVAWSLPLLAAPLAIYALDASLDATQGSSPLDAFIRHALVAPMALALGAFGFDVHASGQTLLLTTPRGVLALTVGLVCAGLEPGVLFAGVLGLHAWREGTPPRRLVVYLVIGLAGVYLANLTRLLVLAWVGYHWGGEALTATHANAGWLVFLLWMILFWGVILRRLEGSGPRPPPTA